MEAVALGNIANSYALMKEYRHAIELYERVLALVLTNGMRREEGSTLWHMSQAFSALGNYELAISAGEFTLKIFEETQWTDHVNTVHETLNAWRLNRDLTATPSELEGERRARQAGNVLLQSFSHKSIESNATRYSVLVMFDRDNNVTGFVTIYTDVGQIAPIVTDEKHLRRLVPIATRMAEMQGQRIEIRTVDESTLQGLLASLAKENPQLKMVKDTEPLFEALLLALESAG